MGVIWEIFSQLRGGLGRGDVTSFIAFVLVMVKEPALSRKSPHPPLCQRGGKGGFRVIRSLIPKDSRRHVHLFRSFTINHHPF